MDFLQSYLAGDIFSLAEYDWKTAAQHGAQLTNMVQITMTKVTLH